MGLDSPSRCIVDSGGKCEEEQLLSAVFRYENAHRLSALDAFAGSHSVWCY